MSIKTSRKPKIGYTTGEFKALIAVYLQNVPDGFLRDYSLTDTKNAFLLSFHRDSRQPPVITVEKRLLGPDNALFVASVTGAKGQVVEVERSGDIGHFVQKLQNRIQILRQTHQNPSPNILRLAR